jgi:hypothetical protein
MNARAGLAAFALALLAACTPPRIPGTEIPSTADTRAVAATVETYRKALEARDVAGIMALVAPVYYDTMGTPDPSDDLDRAGLQAALEKDLPRAEAMKVDFTLRKIDVNGDDAVAEIFFDSYYRVKTNTAAVPKRDTDLQQLHLKRIGGVWKFTSGL